MKKILIVFVVLAIAGCARHKRPGVITWEEVRVSTPEQVQSCTFIDEIGADRPRISDAKKAVRIIAGRRGATNIVWTDRWDPDTSGGNYPKLGLMNKTQLKEHYVEANAYKCARGK